MEKKTMYGQEYEVYTNADWERDSVLKVQVGQLIEPDVYYQLLESVPPVCYRGAYFQPGEPDSWDWERGCQLYQTYKRMGDDYYLYEGLQPAKGFA